MFLATGCATAAVPGPGKPDLNHRIALRLSNRLPAIDNRLAEVDSKINDLPVMPDMDALGSHGYHSDFTEDSESNWFRIAWNKPRRIDGIALIPTRLTTQSGEMSNYGFPHSLRIEAGVKGATEPVIIAELENSRLNLRRGEPVFLSIPPAEVEWLRVIPINLPRFPGKLVRFFSISEFLVFDGETNIAPDGELSARFSIDAEVGWNIRYLVDGQSPLGPPERPPHSLSLGWHTDIAQTRDAVTWAALDLEDLKTIDRVRIIAAKGDSPVKGPGFGFPVGFRVDVSTSPSADDWTSVWSSGEEPFQNPGYNPVTIRFPSVSARRVRLFIHKQHQPDLLTAPRVLLSEIEVINGEQILSRGKPVLTPDRVKSRPHDAKRVWSAAGLTDGHSSTGKLMPLRQWIEQLSLRFDLAVERRALVAEREEILQRTHRWTLTAAFTLLGSTILGLMFWLIRQRLNARRHINELRRRISSDLHDEVGSNLATISLLADISPAAADSQPLGDISRLARESSLSLREIIDLTLVPKRGRKPLPDRLREIAALMLKDHAWSVEGEASPDLDPEQRRNLIFYFKEALHNISRHARATSVRITLRDDGKNLVLSIIDNGCGLPVQKSPGTPRLRALEQRSASLRGQLDIASAPGEGTSIHLTFPLKGNRNARR
jgi:signal transduction histidine kinase